jgi:hypothetical protein
MRTARWLLLVLLAAVGCGGGVVDPTDVDAVPADAELLRDCGCIVPGDLLGRWHAVPSTEDEEPEPAFIEFFTGDSAIATNSNGNTSPWVWSAEGPLLTLTYDVDDAPTQTETFQYAVTTDGGLLMFGAALPAGPVDGVVGTWVFRSFDVDNGSSRTETLAIAADGTGHRTAVANGGEPYELDLTWEQPAPDELVTSSEVGDGMTLVGYLRVIPGVALGGDLYERVAP